MRRRQLMSLYQSVVSGTLHDPHQIHTNFISESIMQTPIASTKSFEADRVSDVGFAYI